MVHLLFAVACTGASAPEDSASPDDSSDDTYPPADTGDDDFECGELSLQVHGEDPPHVGDTWTVFMYCDDVVLNGAGRLSFDPPDFAVIDNNLATFLYAGSATLKMQMGNRRMEQDVTVLE